MNFLSATDFFSKIFDWFANLSSKLPAIDYKTYFIVVVALLIGIGVIIGLTFFGSYRFKLLHACKRIIRYLSDVDAIDNDNFGDFTAQCFSAKAPSALRDCWVQYLGVRFGYPSDIVSEQNVYDKQVKRVREIRANVYIAIALVLIAIFSFWGYGRLDGKDMGVIFLASLLLSGVIYLVLVILNKILSTKCLFVFSNMQEDLDAKVVFQVEKSFATDSSPLADLSAIIDEIVARNTAKEIGFEFSDEQTPIEELIAQTSENENTESGAEENNADVVTEDVEGKQEVGDEPDLTDSSDITEDKKADEASAVVENTEEEVTVDDGGEQADEASAVNVGEEAAPAKQEQEPQDEKPEEADNNSGIDGEVDNAEAVNSVEDGVEVVEITPEEEPEHAAVAEENTDVSESENSADIEEPEVVETSDSADEGNSDEVAKQEEAQIADAAQPDAIADNDTAEDEKVNNTTQQSDDVVSDNVSQPETVDDAEEQPEPEVRYIIDGPTEDDEFVKPAKLVKMPNLVDYVLSQNSSPQVKMNMANMLMASYKKFESSDEDKKIIQDCVKKLMADLQKNKK